MGTRATTATPRFGVTARLGSQTVGLHTRLPRPTGAVVAHLLPAQELFLDHLVADLAQPHLFVPVAGLRPDEVVTGSPHSTEKVGELRGEGGGDAERVCPGNAAP